MKTRAKTHPKKSISKRKKHTHLSTEARWNLVLEYNQALSITDSSLRNSTTSDLLVRYDVNRSTLSRLLARFKKPNLEGELVSLTPGKSSGRPTIIDDAKADELRTVAEQHGWKLTATELAAKIDGVSASTVARFLKKAQWRATKIRIRPRLTTEQTVARKDWCFEHRRSRWHAWVDLDEKYFYTALPAERLYHPPDVTPEDAEIQSKRHIPKVMVLSAIAKPRHDMGFDGKVGLWRVTEEKVAKRSSKNHEKGDVYDVDSTMNAKLFREMLVHKVAPAIRSKFAWADIVHLQMDNASPHTGGNLIEKLRHTLNRQNQTPKIEIVFQPAQSPDTNCNDLGFFRSLQTHVQRIRVGAALYDKDALMEHIQQAWDEYPSQKLTDIFETKTMVLRKIVECGGLNSYKLPHFRSNK